VRIDSFNNIYIVGGFNFSMKKFAILFILLMFSSGVSATMTISKTANVYNLGDKLYISLSGLRGAEHGNFNINLVCSNKTINIVKLPARAFSLTEDQSYSIPYEVLNKEDLGITNMSEILGNCQVVALLGTGIVSTKSFKITNNVDVKLSLNKTRYNPGESVLVKIKAIKANGEMLNGFVEGSNASSFKKSIKNGIAEKIINIPKSAESGIYYLTVRAYGGKNEGVLNEGTKLISYYVNSVATSLVVGISRGVAVSRGKFYNWRQCF